MSLKDNLTKFAGKAKDVAEKSGDKIASGVDKATDVLDKKTGGKHHDKLEKIDNLASKLDKKSEPAPDAAEIAPIEAPTAETPPTEG
jgi:MT0933-like antitoxin protein